MKRWHRNLLILILLAFPIFFIAASYLEDLAETGSQEGTNAIVPLITSLPTHVIEAASGAGYLGIFSLMLLESAAFPVPSEIILPLAGYLVFRGGLQFWPVVLLSTIASLIGSFVDYYIGWRMGSALVSGKARLPYVGTTSLRKAQAWFNAHGPVAVALLRLVPTARVLISFPAGAYRMPKSKFATYTLLGCIPWNILLVYLGWWLGSSWEQVVSAFRYINLIVYAAIILLIAWLGWRISLKRRKRNV